MKRWQTALRRDVLLFLGGGLGYCLMELSWRSYTHWSMGVTGGACLVGMAAIHRALRQHPVAVQALAGAGLITAAEFCVGCVVNLWLGWNVWDYSDWRFDLLGQICPVFCALWVLLALAVMTAFSLADRRQPTDRSGTQTA